MNWNKYPFLRLVMSISLGIALGEALGNFGMDETVCFWGLVGLLGVEILIFCLLKSYRHRWVFGMATILVFVYLGYFRASFYHVTVTKETGGNNSVDVEYHLARVYDPPVEKENSVKITLELLGQGTDEDVVVASGRVMAYFRKTESALNLGYGDLLAFFAPLEELSPPKNPDEFDYRKYLERRGIVKRAYLDGGDWWPVGVWQGNPLFAFSYRFRDRLLDAMRRSGISEDEFGVGAAILLGYDESLPAQLRQNYVAAGSMHILCVSGMHVGIIYLLASFVLGLLGKGKRAVLFKRLILLGLIWFYALLTGLSPSVLRASMMISFLIFGELIHRKGFALNSIAASAFILLLINPNNLFAIGFQLSYAAVVGIVLLQKPIYRLLYVKYKLLDKMWEITAVSLAAQIAVMPFAVYYFHQFTPYFWLSNLLMTPLSFLVILFGMVLLLVSWVPALNVVMGTLVGKSLYLMNEVVSNIERLPYSLIKGLYMDDIQFAMSLMLLVLLMLFVVLKKKRMLMEMLVLSSVFAIVMAYQSQKALGQRMLTFYSVRNHTAIDLVSGFDHVLLCDEALLAEPSSIDYSLKGCWAMHQLTTNPSCFTLEEDVVNDLVVKKGSLLSFQGVLLAFWDPLSAADGNIQKIDVDYLMVRDKQKPDLQCATRNYQIGMLLIDGSVPEYLAKQWIRQAEDCGIPYRNVRDCAFVVDL